MQTKLGFSTHTTPAPCWLWGQQGRPHGLLIWAGQETGLARSLLKARTHWHAGASPSCDPSVPSGLPSKICKGWSKVWSPRQNPRIQSSHWQFWLINLHKEAKKSLIQVSEHSVPQRQKLRLKVMSADKIELPF